MTGKRPCPQPGPFQRGLFHTMSFTAPPSAHKEETHSELDDREEKNPFRLLGQRLPAGNVSGPEAVPEEDGAWDRVRGSSRTRTHSRPVETDSADSASSVSSDRDYSSDEWELFPKGSCLVPPVDTSTQDTMIAVLVEMGFGDQLLNQRLLKKYNYNLLDVVNELVQMTDNDWYSTCY